MQFPLQIMQQKSLLITATQLPAPPSVVSRYGAQVCITSPGNVLFHGGFCKSYLSDSNVYSIESGLSNKLSLNSQPSARRGHSIVRVGSLLYLFGGDASGACSDDVWAFDAAQDAWMQIKPTSQIPLARYGHSAIAMGPGFVIFGGKNPQQRKLLDDTWQYDCTSDTWKQLTVSREAPSQRYGSAMVKISSNEFLIFGGVGAAGRLNDIWKAQIINNTIQWACIQENSSTPPIPRSDCVTMELGGFGAALGGIGAEGVVSDIVIFDSTKSRVIKLDSGILSPRSQAASCRLFEKQRPSQTAAQLADGAMILVDETGNSKVDAVQYSYLIIGGQSGKQILADAWRIDVFVCEPSQQQSIIGSGSMQGAGETDLQELVSTMMNRSQGSSEPIQRDLLAFQQAVIGVFNKQQNQINTLRNQYQNQVQELVQQQRIQQNLIDQLHALVEIQSEENKRLVERVNRLESVVMKQALRTGIGAEQFGIDCQQPSVLSQADQIVQQIEQQDKANPNLQNVISADGHIDISLLEEQLNGIE